MTTIEKTIVSIGIAFCLIIGLFSINKSSQVGSFQQGQVQNDPWMFTGGLAVGNQQQTIFDSSGKLTIGSSGNAMSKLITGTCNLTGGYSLAATTTTTFDCAVTGVKSTDSVVVQAPGTIPVTASVGSIYTVGSNASTTNGYITIKVFNALGAASSTPGKSFLNGWVYEIFAN